MSVDRFCLLAGIEALQEMTVCGARHRRHGERRGYRWGWAESEIGYHGGRVKVARPRVRDQAGKEVRLASWEVLRDGDLLLEWALNLMVLNVSTRKYRRAVRLPEGDLPGICGDGTSKSAVSRRFVGLSRRKMRQWLSSDLSDLDLLVIQIDGLHVGDHVVVAAIGVDGNGDKHVLAVVEGATENTVVVQALLDNLTGRGVGCDAAPAVHRRWREGAEPRDPQHLRHCRRHPSPPGPQRGQHHRAPARAPACERQERASSGLGPGRRRQSRTIVAQPRQTAGTDGPGCGGEHSGGAG